MSDVADAKILSVDLMYTESLSLGPYCPCIVVYLSDGCAFRNASASYCCTRSILSAPVI